jgi:hypothetical protein
MADERQFPEGSRVDDLDLSGVHLHGTNLEGPIRSVSFSSWVALPKCFAYALPSSGVR